MQNIILYFFSFDFVAKAWSRHVSGPKKVHPSWPNYISLGIHKKNIYYMANNTQQKRLTLKYLDRTACLCLCEDRGVIGGKAAELLS